ncbi:MAG: multicopper oxidase family protein [Planctomycetes bacterium]|nr:multicopper oxidase family protein [Planctomycetota bacterium]
MRIHLLSFLAAAPLAAQAIVDYELTAAAGTVDLGPGYASEPARLYNGTLPAPVLHATEGQTLRVRLHNDLAESTILHFHGQPLPQGMDGMQVISRPETAPGQEFLYELPDLVPGTYWFHPHSDHHTQLDSGLAGVLIVDPANPADDPAFDTDHVIVLDDWNAANTGGSYTGHLLNGKTSDGQATITVQPGERMRLRFVNVAAMTNYVVALDGHPMTVTHTDGGRLQPVVTQAIPIGIGERYDVIVDCNNPGVWSLAVSTIENRTATVVRGIVRYAGQAGADPSPTAVPGNLSSGAMLDYAQLASYWPASTPITATPDLVQPIVLGMQPAPGGGNWSINGEFWPNVTPIEVSLGDVVQFDYSTGTAGMMHSHPMHLHGQFVRLMGTAGGATHPPRKDTVLVRPSGQPGSAWSVQYTADNPGSWLFHCHHMMHMMRGMMTLVNFTGDHDQDGRVDHDDMDPTRAAPVLTIASDAAAFQTGGVGTIDLQWQPYSVCAVFVSGTELPLPVTVSFGELRIDAATAGLLGVALCDAAGHGAVPYALPTDPGLIGARELLQAIATTTMPGGLVLSTHQALTLR